ncbi:MAG: helix-turn-helix domain-containing protein [Planctomycetota bacterium]
MAKMFYTLEEASERLGMDEEAVKEMAAEGKLQQFRDRDKLMFKREQVDTLAAGDGGGDGSSIGIPLADPGPDDTDAISLADSMASAAGGEPEDPKEATGISVFDAGEVEPADPMAQTQVTQPQIDDEELALESVGSGSGLLDLTRESDDTSLGAELLDEIYPGGGDTGTGLGATGTSGADFGLESSVGSSGVFEGALSMDTGASGPSGLENLVESDPGSMDLPSAGVAGTVSGEPMMIEAEASDPAGSALGAGLLIGATVALVIGFVVIAAAIAGGRSALTSALVTDQGAGNVMFLCVGLLVLSAVLGGVGFVLGKKSV